MHEKLAWEPTFGIQLEQESGRAHRKVQSNLAVTYADFETLTHFLEKSLPRYIL